MASFTWAGVAVIVHPSVGFDSIGEEDVARLFLGKRKNFPDGTQAIPVNQGEGSDVRQQFHQDVCKTSASQYKAYWAQRVFTGKGSPPADVADDDAVKALIAANPNMIGYINADAVDATVKVIYQLP